MKKKATSLLMVICLAGGLKAQYYYKDIISLKQTMNEQSRLKEQKIRTVVINSYESNGDPSEGFFCEKKLNKDFTKLEIMTQADLTPDSWFTSWFDEYGMLLKTSDSSEAFVASTQYTYDDKKQVIEIFSHSRTQNDDYTDDNSEKHLYRYDSSGLPFEMLLIKNLKDTTVIQFQKDESGQMAIEKNTRTGEAYYYYYNSRGWISDIVHSYAKTNKMIPDLMFEYNRNGQVIQMIASEDEGRNYITWKYSYENGLRIGERCYSKMGKQLGTIEYVYK